MKIDIENRTIFRILVAIALFVLLFKALVAVQTPLLWTAAGIFLAIALNPAVSFIAGYLPRKSRGAAILLVLIAFFAIVGFLIYSFLPPLVSQTQGLIDSIPNAVNQVQQQGGPLGDVARRYDVADKLSGASSSLFSSLSTATGSALQILGNVFSGVAALLTIATITFFALLESKMWMDLLWRLHPADQRARNQELAHQMYRAVTGYVNGNLFTSAIAAVTSALVMTLVGVPFAIPLGILVGLLDLVPLVGATIAAILVVVVASFTSLTAAIILIVFFVIYQQIENNILQPLVYGRSTELSPLIVTIAILLGASIAGLFGALVAIPVAACIKVLLTYRFRDRLENTETKKLPAKKGA
jgi:predicted PurR-regulated permease PerM